MINIAKIALENTTSLETLATVHTHTHTHTLCLLNEIKIENIIIYKRE